MAKVCRQGQGQRHSKGQANYVNQNVTCNDPSPSPCLNTSAGNQSGADAYGMYNVTNSKKDAPLYIHVELNDTPVSMELDTGAAASIVNELMCNRLWGPEVLSLSESIHKLHTYTGQQIQVVGHITHWRIRKIRISRKTTLKICRDILPLYIKSRMEKQACNIVLPR